MKKITFSIVLLLSAGFAFSQSAELRIKKDFPLQISFVSDVNDVIPFIDSLPVMDSNQICFKITPQRTGKTWSKKYPGMLRYLKIYQDENIEFDYIVSSLPNFGDKIMVYFVNKNKIKLSQPFTFKFESTLSSAMKLPEMLMNNYLPFMALFSKAENQINNRFYIEAYKTLSPLFPENERYDNYASLSRYHKGIQLAHSATEKYYENVKLDYDKFLTETKDRTSINFGHLNAIRDIYFGLKETEQTFSSFLNSEGSLGVQSSDISQKYKTIESEISTTMDELEEQFKHQTFTQFTIGDYSDARFKYLIDGITHILLESAGITLINEYQIDSLNPNNLNNNVVLNQIMQSSDSRNLELTLLAKMISENIHQNLLQNKKEYVIFDKDIFDHLESLQYNEQNGKSSSLEPKPYYLLLRGFDLMIADHKNVNAFNGYLKKAMQMSCDEDMMRKIFLWLTSSNLNLQKEDGQSGVRASTKLFNTGYKYFQDQKYDSALLYFQKAQSRFDSYPDTYYYQGLTYLKRGQTFLARYFFKVTLQTDPEYLPALIGICELIDNKADADAVLLDLEYLLASSDYKTQPPLSQSTFWYLNYMEAQMHFILGDYSQCMASLDTECKRLNPFSPDIYILEGLVNIKRGDESGASKSFDEAVRNAIENYFNYEATAENIRIKTKGQF
jgi:Tfp pilus assembly protein PilF